VTTIARTTAFGLTKGEIHYRVGNLIGYTRIETSPRSFGPSLWQRRRSAAEWNRLSVPGWGLRRLVGVGWDRLEELTVPTIWSDPIMSEDTGFWVRKFGWVDHNLWTDDQTV
jgi:hypothetical protein